MKKWKVYRIYAEDNDDVYKIIVPSPSKKEAESYVFNAGLDIVAIKEVPMTINTDYLAQYLKKENFDSDGIDVICRVFQMIGLSE